MPQLKRRQTINMIYHPTMRHAGMALRYGSRCLAQLLPPSIDDCRRRRAPGEWSVQDKPAPGLDGIGWWK